MVTSRQAPAHRHTQTQRWPLLLSLVTSTPDLHGLVALRHGRLRQRRAVRRAHGCAAPLARSARALIGIIDSVPATGPRRRDGIGEQWTSRAASQEPLQADEAAEATKQGRASRADKRGRALRLLSPAQLWLVGSKVSVVCRCIVAQLDVTQRRRQRRPCATDGRR